MKYFRKICIVVMTFVISTSFCFASETSEQGTSVQPYYVGAQTTSEGFQINSLGKATMVAYLIPKSSSAIDEVKVTFKIKNSAGQYVYNKTFYAEWSLINGRYNLTKYYQLSLKGSYQFQAVYKCYKNNNLVETINSSNKIALF